jgi:DNA-binding transcriptional regulator YiaG
MDTIVLGRMAMALDGRLDMVNARLADFEARIAMLEKKGRTKLLSREGTLLELEAIEEPTFDQLILRRRLQLRRTQEEMAERLGMGGSGLSRWESGGYLPSRLKLPGIANAYELSPGEVEAAFNRSLANIMEEE